MYESRLDSIVARVCSSTSGGHAFDFSQLLLYIHVRISVGTRIRWTSSGCIMSIYVINEIYVRTTFLIRSRTTQCNFNITKTDNSFLSIPISLPISPTPYPSITSHLLSRPILLSNPILICHHIFLSNPTYPTLFFYIIFFKSHPIFQSHPICKNLISIQNPKLFLLFF